MRQSGQGHRASVATRRPKRPPLHERIWNASEPIPHDPECAPRKWAARRQLWRPEVPFPTGVRWRDVIIGKVVQPICIVACYALLEDWRIAVNGSREEAIRTARVARPAVPVPTPRKVELIPVTIYGEPHKNPGGQFKRAHGSQPRTVLMLHQTALGSGLLVHVVEDLADGLAIASRKQGAVIVAGGTSGIRTLANDPTELVRTVGHSTVGMWPHGDEASRKAGSVLVNAVKDCGAAAKLAPIPDGESPASIAPAFDNEGVRS